MTEANNRSKAPPPIGKIVDPRDELLQASTHQLKLPLTTLQLQLQLLARTFKRSPEIKSSEVLPKIDAIHQQMRRLSDSLDELEDVSRILQGELATDLRATTGDLSRAVRGVLDRALAQAREQGCQFQMENGPSIWGDWDFTRVERVVANLVRNALLYAPKHRVQVELSVADGHATIEVRDNGPGIGATDLMRINTELKLPSRTASGAGLGLWTSAHLAHAMRGRLSGARLQDGGSVFKLMLPLGV